ncbi:MAG: hypothetical protein WCD04_02370 [Terriglobia bacterium]
MSIGNSLLLDTTRDNQAHNMKKSKALVQDRQPQGGAALQSMPVRTAVVIDMLAETVIKRCGGC